MAEQPERQQLKVDQVESADSLSIFILSPTSARNDQLKCRRPLKDSNNMKLLKLRRKECDGAELTLICLVELIV